METMNAYSVITLNPSTKVECADFAQRLIEEIESGTVNPLEAAVRINAISKTLEVVRKAVNESILKEARTYGEKSFNAFSAEITLAPVKTDYNYDNCNDPVLKSLQSEVDELNQKVKERQQFLKNIPKSLNIATEDGEQVTVYPPIKIQTDGIKISLK